MRTKYVLDIWDTPCASFGPLPPDATLEGIRHTCEDTVAHFVDSCDGDLYQARQEWRDLFSAIAVNPTSSILFNLFDGTFTHLIQTAKPYDPSLNVLRMQNRLGYSYACYDIQGIEDEVLWTNPENGRRYLKPLTEEAFWAAVESHRTNPGDSKAF